MTENIQLVSDATDENLNTFVGDKYHSYYQKKWQLTLGQFKCFNVAAFF